MSSALLILSVGPFLLFIFLLLYKKISLLHASLITLATVLLSTIFIWKIIPIEIGNSFIKGFFISLDILIIVIGAIFFLEILRATKIIDNVSYYLESFSPDYRVQVILLAWFFENFLEGTAGFGTPSTVVAPLLIGLGMPPIRAAILALLGNSVSVAFGAAGTPIRTGFSGLNVTSVPALTALYNHIGFIVPIFMLWVLVSDKKDRKVQFFEALPFAIWSGIAFVVPSFWSTFLGPEFPSIVGSLIGLLLIVLTTKLNLFMPSKIRSPNHPKPVLQNISLLKDFFPYILLIIFLIIGKFTLSTISIPLVIGSIKHSFNLFNPGFAFILSALPVVNFWGRGKSLILKSSHLAIRRSLEPFLVIVIMSSVTQLMINSGQNFSGLASSLQTIAKSFETRMLPLWAPFIGAFGSFITGSATVSNIMFGSFLNLASQSVNLNAQKILSLEVVGAAAGNMVALSDVLTTETVIGLKNQEHKIIRGVIIPCGIYVLATGIIGLLVTT